MRLIIVRLLFALLFGGTVILLAWLLWSPEYTGYERGSAKFDTNRWKAKSRNSSYRWGAVDDLLTRYTLVGMHRNEVVTLLGEPASGPIASPHTMDYFLADQPFIDSYWLLLELDDSGVVTSVSQGAD